MKILEIISKYYDLLTEKYLYYIQNYLIAELMITHPHSQWFFKYPLIKKKFNAPTSVSVNEKYSYWSVPGRWEGHFAEEKYFLSRYSNEISYHSKNLIMSFIKKNRFDIYKSFIYAIEKDNPEILSDFRSGMLQNEFGPFSFIANLLRVAKNSISYIVKKIRKTVDLQLISSDKNTISEGKAKMQEKRGA